MPREQNKMTKMDNKSKSSKNDKKKIVDKKKNDDRRRKQIEDDSSDNNSDYSSDSNEDDDEINQHEYRKFLSKMFPSKYINEKVKSGEKLKKVERAGMQERQW